MRTWRGFGVGGGLPAAPPSPSSPFLTSSPPPPASSLEEHPRALRASGVTHISNSRGSPGSRSSPHGAGGGSGGGAPPSSASPRRRSSSPGRAGGGGGLSRRRRWLLVAVAALLAAASLVLAVVKPSAPPVRLGSSRVNVGLPGQADVPQSDTIGAGTAAANDSGAAAAGTGLDSGAIDTGDTLGTEGADGGGGSGGESAVESADAVGLSEDVTSEMRGDERVAGVAAGGGGGGGGATAGGGAYDAPGGTAVAGTADAGTLLVDALAAAVGADAGGGDLGGSGDSAQQGEPQQLQHLELELEDQLARARLQELGQKGQGQGQGQGRHKQQQLRPRQQGRREGPRSDASPAPASEGEVVGGPAPPTLSDLESLFLSGAVSAGGGRGGANIAGGGGGDANVAAGGDAFVHDEEMEVADYGDGGSSEALRQAREALASHKGGGIPRIIHQVTRGSVGQRPRVAGCWFSYVLAGIPGGSRSSLAACPLRT
ncbi:hypothetical protein PLESTM_001763200 [Pleodorina starrii]|nr:hypothetical protein PLESTM_001763200 [Pleodorina starrii]